MNTKKREGIERIAEIIATHNHHDCRCTPDGLEWVICERCSQIDIQAEALWDAGIRDASGFYVETAFPFSITFDNREKMNNRIKPKVYEVENINKNRA